MFLYLFGTIINSPVKNELLQHWRKKAKVKHKFSEGEPKLPHLQNVLKEKLNSNYRHLNHPSHHFKDLAE